MIIICDIYRRMDEKIENINEKLDELVIRNFELMEEQMVANLQLEQSLRNGKLELAKTRMLRGKENIGMIQVPIYKDDISPLFNLETSPPEENSSAFPQFSISLKSQSSDENNSDPLKWFGILVPQSLKSAQKYFQDATYNAVKIANLKAEHSSLMNEIKTLDSVKDDVVKSRNVN